MRHHGWNPKHNPNLLPYLNENLGAIATILREKGFIAEIPAPLPVLQRRWYLRSACPQAGPYAHGEPSSDGREKSIRARATSDEGISLITSDKEPSCNDKVAPSLNLARVQGMLLHCCRPLEDE
jgi:hypothetical protein